jgi:hypothetical protein
MNVQWYLAIVLAFALLLFIFARVIIKGISNGIGTFLAKVANRKNKTDERQY